MIGKEGEKSRELQKEAKKKAKKAKKESHVFTLECICCTVWLQCLGKPKGSEHCFAVHHLYVRSFSSK